MRRAGNPRADTASAHRFPPRARNRASALRPSARRCPSCRTVIRRGRRRCARRRSRCAPQSRSRCASPRWPSRGSTPRPRRADPPDFPPDCDIRRPPHTRRGRAARPRFRPAPRRVFRRRAIGFRLLAADDIRQLQQAAGRARARDVVDALLVLRLAEMICPPNTGHPVLGDISDGRPLCLFF